MLPEHRVAIETTLKQVTNPALTTRWAYYDGIHPKIYLTPKLRETFRGLADSLAENYCGLAVNSRINRMEVTGWEGEGADAAEKMWTDGGFPQRQDVLYRWGLVHGAAYLIVDEDGITANRATTCYAEPDPDDWIGVSWAGKAWQEDNYWWVTLWDEDTIYRYRSVGEVSSDKRRRLPLGADFQPTDDPEERHGFPRVPVIPINPFGYMGSPLIDQIAPVQDRINKITANKFVAAEFGAFKQRVFFTRQDLDPYSVRQAPDHAIVLDPGDELGKASVQELGGTDLSVYDAAKNAEVDALFTIATLPRHLRVNPGVAPSGEAIKADEGPFVEAVVDHQREFGEALVIALSLHGITAEPIWKDPETHNDLTNAQVVSTLVSAGVPWQVAAEKYLGMSPDEIANATLLTQAQQGPAQQTLADQTAAFLQNPSLL